MIIIRWILLKITNESEKFVEIIKTHFMFSNIFFENRAVYDIIWKKRRRAREAIDNNTAHARCMLNN
jgi:hypothetical protein